ncbi:polyketide synthase [Chlorella sorokiniana]|uniref:Polyketide synthase n=1 Tax=Chlorella sorokiniana TaxID=3076 RepID=A0A2P6TDK3_CHLSO|nr:polyketide synthase [Chlorella sorokiniana]|eukprot:PRW20711.1 polyketide synthase [Chlorella sorokiniana]
MVNQRLPGDSASYVSYLVATIWRGPAASSSGDAGKLVPPSRWDVEQAGSTEVLSKRVGSFVQGAELFDDSFFALSTQEASAMDAQQRLLLEACWEALGHSTIYDSCQHGVCGAPRAVGVAVGISYNEYFLNTIHQGMTAFTATSGTLSVASGRISFSFGLKGPTLGDPIEIGAAFAVFKGSNQQLELPGSQALHYEWAYRAGVMYYTCAMSIRTALVFCTA